MHGGDVGSCRGIAISSIAVCVCVCVCVCCRN